MSTTYDTFQDGIGVLASERGSIDNIQENSPITVSGVAIPENTVLEGGQGVEHFFSPEAAQEAAQVLQEQIESGETVHIVKNFHDTQGQAGADDVIGEVTGAGYSQGVGVVFEGEITDEDIARKVDLGYLDVSPSVARSLGPLDETMQARSVDTVAGFRDIATVARGQPGADVEIGPNPAVEALSRTLSFDALDTLEVSPPEFNGYDTSAWDAPTLEGTFDGDMEAARNSATWIENDGENFSDLSLFILNGNAELNINALDSAWRLAPQTEGPTERDVERLRTMYEDMAEEANQAGAITDDEFDNVWQERVADTDAQQDTMSLDEAKQTLAEEYELDVDDLESHLETLTDPEDSEPSDDDTVLLIE